MALVASTLILGGFFLVPYPYDRFAMLAGAVVALVMSYQRLHGMLKSDQDNPDKSH
jgi:hypothetical protein